MQRKSSRSPSHSRRRQSRRGALLSIELMILLPLAITLLFGMLQFSLVISANQRLKEASRQACRIASRPCANPHIRAQLIHEAMSQALGRQALMEKCVYRLRPGKFTGDPVIVVAELPMDCTAPDLLAPLGFYLQGRKLVARTVMRKE